MNAAATLTAAEVFELQAAARLADARYWDYQDEVRYGRAPGLGSDLHLAARDKAQEAVKAGQDALGGHVFRVPDYNLGDLTTRVDKINRRAAKLGVEPITLTITAERWDHTRQGDGGVIEVTPHTFVILTTNVVKLDGYRFAATIEHDEDGNIVRTVPGVEADLVPYRTVEPWCEHCKTLRRRNDTFVVLHDDGHTMQVGRNCLVDFLGSSATAAAQQAQWMVDLFDAFEDAEREGTEPGARAESTIPLDEFLTHVALMIRTHKWVSRGAAYEWGDAATADLAANNLYACRKARYTEPGPRDYHVLPEQQDADEAAAAIEWAREFYGSKAIEDRDDFEHNMAVATAHDYLPTRRTGIAAYAVQARRKAIEVEVKAKAAKQADDAPFLGEVKGKVTVEVTLARITSIEDRYNGGTKPLYEFVTADGSIVKWFSSRWIDGLEQGGTYTITGTVKEHNDGTDRYTGQKRYPKSTMLTRCKVVAA
jgi:hypothetical protein